MDTTSLSFNVYAFLINESSLSSEYEVTESFCTSIMASPVILLIPSM